ncbi:MAG: lysylphosphatidylglycerol synthase domain-containing protein [Longimicrobiales bacterium]
MATKSRTRSFVRFGLGLAVFVGVLFYLVPSWAELSGQVEVAVPFLVLGLLGAAGAHVAVAARWKLLSEATGGNRLRFWAYLHSLLVTRFIGQFAPSLAMDLVGRGVALRSVGSKRGVGHAMTLVVLERIFDLVVPAGLLLWAVAVRQFGFADQAVPLLVGATALFLLLATPGLAPLTRLALAIYARFKRDPIDDVVEVTPWVSFQVALLGVARFAAVLVQFAGIGAGVGLLLSWSDWAAATPVAQLTALVGITPGGLGVVEVGWWGGLAWVGVERPVIALYLLAQRTALIAFLGALALATWPFARRAPEGVVETA